MDYATDNLTARHFEATARREAIGKTNAYMEDPDGTLLQLTRNRA